MGFYTIDDTDLEEVCRVRQNSMLATIYDILAATDQSVHADVYKFTKAFDRVLLHFL